MKFTPQILDDIRSRVSITAVVGRRVQWDRRKSNPGKGDMWACCPFHTEKSPSFHVEERKGRYHCFGCKASGDMFTFLVEKDGLSFPEAVEQLASEAGIKLIEQTPQEVEREQQRLSLYDVMDLAEQFYVSNLSSAAGRHALDYLRKRGLTDATIMEFRLGHAANSRTALKEHLASKDVTEEEMLLAGLIIAGEEGAASYDRFRDRVMFPIHDAKGRVIAFGGRALAADAPAKYLNSPETPLFSKGRILFNFHRARPAAFQQSKALVVEGYLDVIMLHQAGIAHAVAPLGTAMTDEQLQLLWKVVPTPYLCFDGDDAGFRAANRAFEKAFVKLGSNHDVRVAFMPRGQDPADLVADGKVSVFTAALDGAMTASEFFWWRSTQTAKIDSPEEKSALEKSLTEQVALIEDPLVRKHYAQQMRLKLSNLFYLHDRTILRKKGVAVAKAPPLADIADENIPELERTILGLAVHFPAYFDEASPVFRMEFTSPTYQSFQSELQRLLAREHLQDVAAIYTKLDEQFFFVLQQVHGEEEYKPDNEAQISQPRGHRLFARCPMAKYDMPRDLVADLFQLYCLMLERAKVKQDVNASLHAMQDDFSARDSERLVNLMKVLDDLSSRISNEERSLVQLTSEFAALSQESSKDKRDTHAQPQVAVFEQTPA
jgi:DNA primase